MSRTLLGFLTVASLALAGCGSTTHFADKSRPPTPVNLSVYVNDSRVSVSPSSVGAGPVVFFVTNQASATESVNIETSGGASQLATTGPINPNATQQVTVDFNPGAYVIATSATDSTGTAPNIAPAELTVGRPRPSADNALLQP